MSNTTTFNFPADSKRLLRALETPDDIGAVIRVHFEIDRALDHVISALIPDAGQLRLQYTEPKVRLLLALGLPEARVAPVRIINAVRNKFAHHEKESIAKADVSKLEASIAVLHGNPVPSHFAWVNTKDDARREWRYNEMTLKEKFCFLGFFAIVGVATIENDFSEARLVSTRDERI